MPITLVTGPANAGKAEVVMDAVRRYMAHGREPILVVPTRADAEHYLRELAGGGVAMGARVERFAGLMGEAGRRAGAIEPVLGDLGRARVIERLAWHSRREPGHGLVRAVERLVAELQMRRISPARLTRAFADWARVDGGGASRAWIAEIYSGYRDTLGQLGRVDAEQRSVRALDALREQPALWGSTPVLFYGFDDLTDLQLDAIETLGRVVDAEVTVSLAYEPGRAAFAGRARTYETLAPLAREERRLDARPDHYAAGSRSALSHLERSLFEPGAARISPGDAVRLLEGGGERSELELVAAEIRCLLDGGMAAEDIAVLVRPAGISADLLEEVLSSAGVPFAMRRDRRFADVPVGRALIGLLRCVPASDGRCEGELDDLLAWLRAPGLLRRADLADGLEIRARRGGALSADQARALWEERHWPLDSLERMAAAQAAGTARLIDTAARELRWLFSAPRRRAASILSADELDDARALAHGQRALSELRDLSRAAPELAPSAAAELAKVLDRLEFPGGERPGTGAVAVLDPLELRARRVRALFVCGLQEGSFPSHGRPAPFLAEDDRRRLAETSGLVLGELRDQLAAERYLLYAALSRPEERLFLSWHLADDEGQVTPRSLFVDDVCDLFGEELSRDRRSRPMGAADSPAPLHPSAQANGSPTARTLEDAELLAALRERVWSASSLERWIRCPVAWFVERMLHPGTLEPDPEPLARGGLAHAALRDTLEALRAETGSARLNASNLDLARSLLRRALAENEPNHPLSVAPERRATVRRRLRADLERYLELAAQEGSELEPTELELGFGFDGDDDHGTRSRLPALDLGGGVRLRGRIDRVDIGPGGEAVVYDYKGGTGAAPAANWIADGNLQVALYMSAVERLLGLRAAAGLYQPLMGRSLQPRGAVDRDSGLELSISPRDLLDADELRDLIEHARAAARGVAEQAAAGRLEPRPATCSFKGGCSYPAICRCER